MKPFTIRVVSGLLALGYISAAPNGVVSPPSAQSRMKPVLSRTKPAVELRLRRTAGQLDVVIEGLGTQVRAVSQSQSDSRWSARLTGVDLGDRPFTPQQTVLSSSELLSVRLEPIESDLQLIVKARMGERVPTPTIASNGDALVVSFSGLTGPEQRSSGRLDLRRPGRVAQPVTAPPLRSRASAPPLGDIAVGTMLINNRSFVNASGPPVSLTLNQAPAKDALMSLARLGGYGFVFVGDIDNSTGSEGDSSEYPVTMSFRGERYARALNSVLMASGLQGRLDGNTLLVGTAVSAKSFGPQMSKVFRMNQVDVESAGSYLGNLGAAIQVAKTTTITSRESETSGTSSNSSESSTSSTSTTTEVDTYGSGVGPLLGLVGTTDTRLNTITLIGDPKLISVAESYLKQIDLRKRQVAVKVQILNIDLLNDKSIDTSFSAQIGNTFLVSESGKAFMNFGNQKPGNSDGTGVLGNETAYATPGSYSAGTPQVQSQAVGTLRNDVFNPQVPAQDVIPAQEQAFDVRPPFVPGQIVTPPAAGIPPQVFPDFSGPGGTAVYVPDPNPNAELALVPRVDANGQPIYVPSADPSAAPVFLPRVDANGQPVYVSTSDPSAPLVLRPRLDSNGRQIFVQDRSLNPDRTFVPRVDKYGRPVYVPGKDPNEYRQPQDSFLAYVEAVIESKNAKTLATPTLLVQEGNAAKVQTGTSVITDVTETITDDRVTISTTRRNAGLTLNLDVAKIDDNGFITLSVNPEVSVPEIAGVFESPGGADIVYYNITDRSLESGSIRLRDRQTLVLTGVIQDKDREVVSKWPILGDLPFLGSLFRKTTSSREKNELVILVTPSIVDDDQGGSYGYGYRPSTREARQLLGTR